MAVLGPMLVETTPARDQAIARTIATLPDFETVASNSPAAQTGPRSSSLRVGFHTDGHVEILLNERQYDGDWDRCDQQFYVTAYPVDREDGGNPYLLVEASRNLAESYCDVEVADHRPSPALRLRPESADRVRTR